MNKKLAYPLYSIWYLTGFFWLAVVVVPIIFIANNSFKSLSEFFNTPLWSLPENLRISNYIYVLKSSFFTYFMNSVVIVLSSLLILITVSLMAAYVFKRRFTHKFKFIYLIMISGMTIPIHITLIPIYSITNAMGIYDSIAALVGPYVAFNIPVSVFILTSFLRVIPKELEEAASIDGAGMVYTFMRCG